MLSFVTNTGRFQFRAAAVILHNGRLLLHRASDDPFWALPGGRVESGEEASQAITRELHEELGVVAKSKTLRFFVESFFTYKGVDFHELGLYFDVELTGAATLINETSPFVRRDGDAELLFQWFKLEELALLDVRPSFLIDELPVSPQGVRHIVSRGR